MRVIQHEEKRRTLKSQKDNIKDKRVIYRKDEAIRN
jgi:hypothetical protein